MLIRATRKINISRKKEFPPWCERRHVAFASGRQAVVALIRALKLEGTRVLLPVYVPEGLYAPFKTNGCEIHFYDLDDNLQPDYSSLEASLRQYQFSFAVFIHYFGIYGSIREFKAICARHEVMVLEDIAHLISPSDSQVGLTGDFALLSLNKILGVPDGAPLLLNNSVISEGALKSQNSFGNFAYVTFRIINLLTANMLSWRPIPTRAANWISYLMGGTFNSYKILMRTIGTPAGMSLISRYLVSRVEYDKLIARRVEIFKAYHERLHNSIFEKPSIPNILNHAYFGYPVQVRDRDLFIAQMLKRGVLLSTLTDKWSFIGSKALQAFNANKFIQNHVIFPTSELLSPEDVEHIIHSANDSRAAYA